MMDSSFGSIAGANRSNWEEALWLIGALLGAGVLVLSGGRAEAATPRVEADTTRPVSFTSSLDPAAGQLLRRYLDEKEYGSNQQNWDAAQDSSGVLYVANTAGLLIYDGRTWTKLTDDLNSVSSVVSDSAGRVFVGGTKEFGMIQTDSLGRRTYESLSEGLAKKHQAFREVKRVVSGKEGVYFQGTKRLFRWSAETDSLKIWTLSGAEFQLANEVRDRIYVNVTGQGLMTVRDGALKRVKGGKQIGDLSVHFIMPHGDDALLVGAYGVGLLRYQDGTFRSFSTEADSVLSSAWLYKGRRLRDGTIAVSTIDRGLLLLTPDGQLRRTLRARGEPVTGLYEDREGGLWAMLDGGLIRYDVGAPFTEYTQSSGLQGVVTDLEQHEGTVYASTNQATYQVPTRSDTTTALREIHGVDVETGHTPSWDLLSLGEDLLVATNHGVARKRPDGTVRYVYEGGNPVYEVLQSRRDSSRFYFGTDSGLRLVTRTGETWTDQGMLVNLGVQVREMAQSDDGSLWLGTSPSRLYRVRGLVSDDSLSVKRFGPDEGLPDGPTEPYRWQNEVVFGKGEGIFRYRPSSSPRFQKDSSITRPDVKGYEGSSRLYVQTDARGRRWGMAGRAGRWVRRDSTWRWAPGVLYRLSVSSRVSTLLLAERSEAVWFGMWGSRIVRYVPGSGWARDDVPTLIRRVFTAETDSLLGVGAAAPSRLSEAGRGIRITYGAPSLVDPGRVIYQYKMTGGETGWSDWTEKTEQTYRNMEPGRHTFSVRARTAYGDTTRTARYAFVVPPPWYRTWWAYGGYVLLAMGLLAGAVQWRTRRLRKRQEELEATVDERTREIEEQKQKLAEQAERLKELDEAKSRFFANVSHEFRTPLTLILGPVQDLQGQVRRQLSDEAAKELSVVERNAQRLLRLVDQILGIARMDAGTYQLDARPTALHTEVARIARTFEPLAEREGLALTVTVEEAGEDETLPYVDREALEHIVGNLLSNAIKFTPEGGAITVSVVSESDAVALAVTDTGPGIPEDEQDAVFDRFEQARTLSGSAGRSEEGAGIGLAFVQDLVDLHGGTVAVESTEGEGTTFTTRFRRGGEHLPDEHLAASDGGSQTSESASPPAETDAPDDPDIEMPSPTDVDGPAGDEAPADASDETVEQKKRVLIVEDNADVRQYVRSILTPDFEVLEAVNGAEGLETARAELPDVILADVMMPEMGGHEMTRELKADPETRAIPVIMVTARAGTGDEVEGLQVGADDYVTKPFDADVLRQRVGGVFALQERLRKRLQQELSSAEPEDKEDEETDERSEVEQEARQVIREHLTDPDFDASMLAQEMAMSRSTLYRRFNDDTDTTPSALITTVRMERAETLLCNQEGTVTQVAYAVGFDQLSSFSRAFREYAGRSPSTVAEDGA